MSPPSSSDEAAISYVSSEEDDISLPPSPSPSPEPSPEPYASSSEDAPPAAKKPRRPRSGTAGRARSWPTADEVVLLEAVVAHRERHGRPPSRDDLAAALAGRLRYSGEQAAERVSTLRSRYYASVRRLSRGTVPVTDDDMRVYRLSKRLWEGTVAERAHRAADKAARRHHERRGSAELEALYPCLAAEVEAIASRRPCGGVLKTAFGMIGDERAAALEARVRKQRRAEVKAGMKRAELRGQVARTLLEFIK
ncbi:hypothetical protein CFC21_039329 [Triticum aestivum]|uniref:Glabrous enhancer-binding protein-like DBD domain-containing protein n=3 Tax=Triticum TaxID=4564 RepID=A0A9R1RWF4_TRITD|nr:uncharacterized protein LOC123068387 [Triticum aestivum]KAF7027274.1 hypothetical protein CFC21_039329 [Triticum aestivum]VAH71612.1 unnamed protein product [Triticum turgidum subsp. durum]